MNTLQQVCRSGSFLDKTTLNNTPPPQFFTGCKLRPACIGIEAPELTAHFDTIDDKPGSTCGNNIWLIAAVTADCFIHVITCVLYIERQAKEEVGQL